jgi:hypothetical protein
MIGMATSKTGTKYIAVKLKEVWPYKEGGCKLKCSLQKYCW